MTLLLNKSLISKQSEIMSGQLFSDIVKDFPEMRNLPEIFLMSFKNVRAAFH